jgi:hypothetical protein
MKKAICIFGFLFLSLLVPQQIFAQTIDVFHDFSVDPGWDGSGNTGNTPPNITDFGYRNIEGVSGVAEGDYGSIGGVFCRTITYSYYADTDLNGVLDRTMTFKISGMMKLNNRSSGSFDGDFYLGYFDAISLDRNNFIGVHFVEPSGAPEAPFRGFTGVYGPGGAATGIIDLAQDITIDFDLTWTGNADGSGTFIGTLAGQDLNLSIDAGTGTFNAFGLMCGGTASDGSRSTRNCYFDNITYTKLDDGSTRVDQNIVDLISIYPGVTTDRVYFNNFPEESRVLLFDVSGRIILESKASELNGGLSLQQYKNGIYLIRVIHGQKLVRIFKVVKKN